MPKKNTSSIEVVPIGEVLGADLLNVRLDSLSAADCTVIRAAWREHLVLRIGGLAIDEAGFLSFTRHFGTPMLAPAYPVAKDKTKRKQTPITFVTNIRDERGRPLGALGTDSLAWHSDMAYSEAPPVHTVLHALEVPDEGGDTGFLNMFSVYESLGPSLRRLADTLRVRHPSVETDAQGEPLDVTEHPLVQTDPETGKKALFLGRRPRASLVGLPRDESEEILDRLWRHTELDKFTWTQRWRSGDLVMWDNRYVMHRRDGFDPADRRLLRRVTLAPESNSESNNAGSGD
ncbi:MAG: taurine catabolism dioxygenase TauD [Rhodospirillaceae bacterium]|nr:taurine catabolism dioxygenase TauD [Rhodospirillaceae bacterium]HAA92504.1 taurine catabolism dioxygenase TauD [Rhodospirillaceae bacterium]|tara:strand:- start:321 stop:1187 length:867 start_codon:yes stop_codon:yes gene_type:complete